MSPHRLVRGALLGAASWILFGCAPKVTHPVIPAPASARLADGAGYVVDTVSVIRVDAGDAADAADAADAGDVGDEAEAVAVRIAGMLADLVGATRETTPRILPPGSDGAADMVLSLDRTDLGEEGYAVRVSPDGVRVEASEPAGLFYGIQTLRQLFPPEVEFTARRAAPLPLPAVEIEDRPRFGWRGAMLDVTRHFFTVDEVKRYIDLLAQYKFNRLHLHLSDDQGWRIEIPDWPALTEIGGSTEVGGGPGGFYTAADYTDLVNYAAERFITIVPEIDMPGHTNAALASYPELNCDGEAPPLYTGIQVGFSALCVEREVTYRFVDDVVRTLAE
ncbi:MAG TPA: family 20 glycosylhydrolase, partial [Longimicrobiales bacterium]|nr:family 20 glycosylhydrolase [Longimicrobiales bacterium]